MYTNIRTYVLQKMRYNSHFDKHTHTRSPPSDTTIAAAACVVQRQSNKN